MNNLNWFEFKRYSVDLKGKRKYASNEEKKPLQNSMKDEREENFETLGCIRNVKIFTVF